MPPATTLTSPQTLTSQPSTVAFFLSALQLLLPSAAAAVLTSTSLLPRNLFLDGDFSGSYLGIYACFGLKTGHRHEKE